MADERTTLHAYVHNVSSDVAKSVIRDLQRTSVALSGPDSGLKNGWDELCVQCRTGASIHWDAYDHTVRQCIRSRLSSMPCTLLVLMWFTLDTHGYEDSNEYEEEELIGHLAGVVYDLAESYSNKRIERYLEGQPAGD